MIVPKGSGVLKSKNVQVDKRTIMVTYGHIFLMILFNSYKNGWTRAANTVICNKTGTANELAGPLYARRLAAGVLSGIYS